MSGERSDLAIPPGSICAESVYSRYGGTRACKRLARGMWENANARVVPLCGIHLGGHRRAARNAAIRTAQWQDQSLRDKERQTQDDRLAAALGQADARPETLRRWCMEVGVGLDSALAQARAALGREKQHMLTVLLALAIATGCTCCPNEPNGFCEMPGCECPCCMALFEAGERAALAATEEGVS